MQDRMPPPAAKTALNYSHVLSTPPSGLPTGVLPGEPRNEHDAKLASALKPLMPSRREQTSDTSRQSLSRRSSTASIENRRAQELFR